MTSDLASAREFYASLFGWGLEDIPAAGYTVASLDGKPVAGMFGQPEGQPPSWLSYVSVEDTDRTAGRARELGAAVLREPADVGGAGRVAVLADPQGAVFALWQPLEYAGAALVNDPGALSLTQLNTSDPKAAQSFYGDLFGWRVEFTGSDEQDYWGLYVGDNLNAGMMPMPAGAPGPPHWLAYFTSSELEPSAAKISELGGTVVMPPMPAGPGRIAVAHDPQGAFFALYEGEVDP